MTSDGACTLIGQLDTPRDSSRVTYRPVGDAHTRPCTFHECSVTELFADEAPLRLGGEISSRVSCSSFFFR